ncbi:hypothetical protein DB31_6618 [Hyalangium minutum]|uniref:Uncharacterized protein n=1 Tax=Hyalangium minutum TaxID=394096 RepID=A0A085WPN0_9BACT|nr:hypothetical protein DB31_6618 [Hyalangium minutum]
MDRDDRRLGRAGAVIVEVAAAPCATPLRVISRTNQAAGRERQQSGSQSERTESAHNRNTVTKWTLGSTSKSD